MTILETPEVRVEGRDKVTGAARYAADFSLPGMLHAAFASSPYAHARIRAVDTSAARAMPGVRAVITGSDVRPKLFGRALQDWPVLAWDRVLFIGDRVAAVAADTLAQAEAAARAIAFDYEELPAILDPARALDPGAPVLHPDFASYRFLRGTRNPVPHPNVQGYGRHDHGDVAAGFAQAARVFEHTFELARVHQGYIEPRACLVWIAGEVVHIVTTNKAPFGFRDQMAATLGIPAERIVIDADHIGGDFGGKGLSVEEPAVYELSLRTGRPVKSVMRYADDVQATNTRHAATIHLRTGVSAEGRIVAHEAHVVFDGGAYAAGKPVQTLQPGEALFTLSGYDIPNVSVESTTVYTNAVPGGHDRAPGQPQNSFAGESHVDLIARGLGIDPLEFRSRNIIRPGGVDIHGERWERTALPTVLRKLREESQWGAPLQADHGRGCALGVRHVGRGKSSLLVRMDEGGDVEIFTGVTDQGGGAHTLFQRIVATELGIPLERVRVRRGTTAQTPLDAGVGGSRVTPVQGGAALDGARKLKALLAEGKTAPLEVEGTHTNEKADLCTYAYAVEVRVDRETGEVRLVDALLVADVGTVINPVALRGQLEGGFAFGLGQALMEDLRVEDGRVTTANLGDYKLPTIADVPPLRLVLVTDLPGPGPFGAKSVGELSNPGIGPAIANAIADAVGARVFSLPLAAEKVLAALREGAR